MASKPGTDGGSQRTGASGQETCRHSSAAPSSGFVLTLNSVKLTEVPVDTTVMHPSVRELYLRDNWLDKVPEELLNLLPGLNKLDLSENRFTTVPNHVFQFPALEIFNMNRNCIERFPASASEQCCELEVKCGGFLELVLSRNQLHTIGPEICQFKSLVSLSLAFNKLTVIPPELGELSHLRLLLLNSNHLAEFPACLVELKKIRVIDISHNQIRAIPHALSRVTTLRELRVGNNRLTNVPFVPSLRYLESGRCTLGQLKFNNSGSESLSSFMMQLSHSLSELNLAKSALTVLPDEIGLLTGLKRLYLANNQLKRLPVQMGNLRALEYLDLSNNHLKALPDMFEGLARLQYLYLQYNRLQDLPCGIVKCPKLIGPEAAGYFDVRGNPLSRIPVRFQRSTTLLAEFLTDLNNDSAKSFTRSRVAFLGGSGVGKTALVKKIAGKYQLLFDGMLKHSSHTLGIDVEEVRMKTTVKGEEQSVTLSLWDFAGAEAYQDVQQYFLAHHAQYVILFKMEDFEPSRLQAVEYWLNCVQAVAPGAAVYIVGTFCKHATDMDLKTISRQLTHLLKEWEPCTTPAVRIIGSGEHCYWRVNTSVRSLGIDELVDMLLQRAVRSGRRGIPNSYIYFLKQVLKAKADGKKVMKWKKFKELGATASIPSSKIKRICRWLHDQGFLVYFPDEHYGKNEWVVVNPLWLMKVFAAVITRQFSKNPVKNRLSQRRMLKEKDFDDDEILTQIESAAGDAYISEEQLVAVWNIQHFNRGQFKSLVNTLERFRVVTKWKHESPHTIYLVPALLPRKRSSSHGLLTGSKERAAHLTWDNSHYRMYGLPFYVPGVFSGLLVRLKKRFGVVHCWKNGLSFNHEEQSMVEISLSPGAEDLASKVGLYVLVNGCSKVKVGELVALIHWEIEHLVARSYTPALWSNMLRNTWICHEDLWIKRKEVIASFVSAGGSDTWTVGSVTGNTKDLVPELYAPPTLGCEDHLNFKKEVTVVEKLSESKQGEIWKATYHPTSEESALDVTVLFFKIDGDRQRRGTIVKYVDGFIKDMLVRSDLEHPNVRALHDYYLCPPCFVMEYVECGSLGRAMQDLSSFTWDLIVRICKELAEGMRFLHDHEPRVLHGSLTAESVLLASLDAEKAGAIVKIADYRIKAEGSWQDVSAYFSIVSSLVDAYQEHLFEDAQLFDDGVALLDEEMEVRPHTPSSDIGHLACSSEEDDLETEDDDDVVDFDNSLRASGHIVIDNEPAKAAAAALLAGEGGAAYSPSAKLLRDARAGGEKKLLLAPNSSTGSSCSSTSSFNSVQKNRSKKLRLSMTSIEAIDSFSLPPVLQELLKLSDQENKSRLPDFDHVCNVIYRHTAR